jgi:hypothetical protein
MMASSTTANKSDFDEMDNAGISKEHWKIMFISGMGFFTDAYDLFVIGVVMALGDTPPGSLTGGALANAGV